MTSGRDAVLVAHHVGGAGGMERQAERMLLGLLDAGWRVTVIARSCAPAPREGLMFVRVRVPRRPATLAFPAFFIVGTWLARRRRGTLLHTTGALVANRADVSTVHYCHRAARGKLSTSRASRPDLPHRVNASVSSWLALAGERWCYRRERTGLLCAVSGGVAEELRAHFPDMAGQVRTVPNGVDTSQFRPDPAPRSSTRAVLGIDEHARLALFVGGDWERKGLRSAVDALVHARGWHLAVVGQGDEAEMRRRARQAGVEERLHLLGPVEDPSPVYAAADAFVLPTAYETFSLVSFEAAASGLALLVTRVSGVEDLLQDGSNGWFITRDPGDIAGRLNALAADPDLLARMGAEARDAAGGFSWEAMVAGYLAVYDEASRTSRTNAATRRR